METPYIFLESTANFEKIKNICKKAFIKDVIPIPLCEMGVDEDLSGKELYVTNIDEYKGIGGSLSMVWIWIDYNGKFKFFNDYLIPTEYLNFV